MKQSDFPPRLAAPIAQNAAASDIAAIPATQASSGDGTASLALGFPPETFIARSAGGVPPRGQDMNGLLNLISKSSSPIRPDAGGFDAGFAQSIGGYPAGAVVAGSTPGTFWVSTADDNVSAPGGAGARWQNLFTGYLPLSGGTVSWLTVAGALVQQGFQGVVAKAAPTAPQSGDFINYPGFCSVADGRGGEFCVGLQEEVGTTFKALLSLQFADGSWRYVRWGQNSRINDSQYGDVAYTSDLQNYVSSSVYSGDFATSDSRVINLPYGHKIQVYTVSNVQNHQHGDPAGWYAFPQAFSGQPLSIVANTSDDGDQDVWTYGWSSTGCFVMIPNNSIGKGLLVSIIAVGPK